jgi:hypothetical protein
MEDLLRIVFGAAGCNLLRRQSGDWRSRENQCFHPIDRRKKGVIRWKLIHERSAYGNQKT